MHIDWFLEDFKYAVTGGSAFRWNCFDKRARTMDFNNVSVVFDTTIKSVYALFITPSNAQDTPYVWVRHQDEVAFKREAELNNVNVTYLHSTSVAMNWAKRSQNNLDVDLTEDEYIELDLSDAQLEAINVLLNQGMTIEEIFTEALDGKLNHDVSKP